MHTAWSSHALSSVKAGTEAIAQVEGTEAQDRAVEHLIASAQEHKKRKSADTANTSGHSLNGKLYLQATTKLSTEVSRQHCASSVSRITIRASASLQERKGDPHQPGLRDC